MRVDGYQLSIDLDFRQRVFKGKVRINGALDSPTLRLNSIGLEIHGADSGGRSLTVRSLEPSQEIELGGLPAHTSEVEVEYSGKVPDSGLVGWYKSEQPPDYVLVTQFESTGARRVFPCVDRPDQKATVDLELVVDSGLVAIFNTPARETHANGDRQTIRFAQTPRMSTYLVFLAVGKFDVLKGEGEGTPVAVWTPPGQREKGRFALELTQRALREFGAYYGVPYPLPKMDLISVRDFGAGAMENWGAIASRERLLLVDERTTSALRRAVSVVTAHELAHQWFGNLVTMHWWDDIWLNESFASFMSYKVLERLGDSPDIWNDFLLVEMTTALLGDSLPTSHPIRQPVEAPEEIDQIFDEISYGKGASVLRMLEGFLGAETFRQGVHDYLVQFEFRNARSEDLWGALENAARQPITDLMRRWVDRPGHPVLIVHRSQDGIHLEQRRFSVTGDHPRQYWPVPLVARTNGRPLRVLMSGPEITLNVPMGSEIFLNEGAVGFYRVLYDGVTYDDLLARFARLVPSERWMVLQDIFAFLLSGDVSFDRWRSFVERTVEDPDTLVAQATLSHLLFLVIPFHDDPEFVSLFRRFHEARTQRLGLSPRAGEGDAERRLRDMALRGRIILDPEFADELSKRFSEFDALDPDLRPSVAMAYARSRGAAGAEELWTRLKSGNDAVQQQMARALGALEDPMALAAALERAADGGMSFSQLPWTLFEALRRAKSRPVVWNWFRSHCDQIVRELGGTSFLHLVVEEIVGPIGSDRLEEVTDYFQRNSVVGAERGVQKGLEYARLFARLRARRRAETGAK